jgi:hypothetical protein
MLGAIVLAASAASSGMSTLASAWLTNLVLAAVVIADEITHRRAAKGETTIKK